MNIEELRKFCLSLPEVTEDIKWGHDLCFMINEKMFCVTGADSKPMMVSLKVQDHEFNELIETDNIISAPYVGRFKWVLVQDVSRFTKKEWEHYITQSFELIKAGSSKKKKSSSAKASEDKRKKKPSAVKSEKLKMKSGVKSKSVGVKKKSVKKRK